MGSDQKGRESDTFTPSPVDTMKVGRLAKHSPGPSPHLALNLHRQSKIRCMYNDSPPSDNGGQRPDSSSSAGSDWDNGQATVRRQNGVVAARENGVYAGLRKGIYNLGLGGETPSSVGSLLDVREPSQPGSEQDFSRNDSDVGNFSAQTSNFNLKNDAVKKSNLLSSVVNKDFPRKGLPKMDPYRRAATLGHRVETRAQVHHVESVNKYYPSSETGIYAPCLEGKTQENVDILEIRVPSTIGCNPRQKSLYVPQAFHNSLTGKKDNSSKHVLSTQLRHLSQELPDVYHERNVGLGLAPSLSTLLAADNIGSFSEDQHLPPESSLLSRSINLNSSQKRLPPRQKPPLPPKRIPNIYNHSHGPSEDSKKGGSAKNSTHCGVRDQGDGGSFTDLSCPSQVGQDTFPPSLKMFTSFLNNLENLVSNGHNSKIPKSDSMESVAAATFNKPNVITTAHDSDKSQFYFSNDLKTEEPGCNQVATTTENSDMQNDDWTLDANRNLCTSSTTSDTEGSDMDNSKNISTVKRNPKHALKSS